MNYNVNLIVLGMVIGSLPISTACQGEPAPTGTSDESRQPLVVHRFSCVGKGCPPPEELNRQLGGCVPSVRLEDSRIDIEVTVKGGVRPDGSDSDCHQTLGGISTGR